MKQELEAARLFNFDWARNLSDVWQDYWDDPNLHAHTRELFAEKLTRLHQGRSDATLGWFLTGTAGAGKTHLLGVFRRKAWESGATFILVDMTGVRDFWQTVLQATLDSLQQRVNEHFAQYQKVLAAIIHKLGPTEPLSKILRKLASQRTVRLKDDIDKFLRHLNRAFPDYDIRHQDVIRALFCWNSGDYGISSTGYTWLQGQSLTGEERAALGFSAAEKAPADIMQSLTWLLSKSGPTVIAFDQLDTIVRQHHVASMAGHDSEAALQARAIIQNVGEGFGTLRDHTHWTWPVVACLESSLPILRDVIQQSYMDRYEPDAERLSSINAVTVSTAIVRQRLAEAFRTLDYEPSYPTWPFRPEAFGTASHLTPRELLKLCHRKRNEWISKGRVTEVASFADGQATVEQEPPTNVAGAIDQLFTEFVAKADVAVLQDEKQADANMAAVLGAALQCLVTEGAMPAGVRPSVATEFTGATSTRPLHARVSLVHEDDGDREEVVCYRAIQHQNARAFQARLKAAMTESGIDRALPFRALTVIRHAPMPGGELTAKLIEQFENAGGVWAKPTDADLRTMIALARLRSEPPSDLDAWLIQRKPASGIPLFATILRTAADGPVSMPQVQPSSVKSPSPPEPERPAPKERDSEPTAPKDDRFVAPDEPITLGAKRDSSSAAVTLPVEQLYKHTLILAGSGSGKTVLLKRLIEEAALRRIPSIVIDPIGNLAQLGQPWAEPPEAWGVDDPALAKRFQETSEVVVWTPGWESGRPLSLELIPDLAGVASSPDELEGAVAMIKDMLAPIAAAGRSQAAENKRGILSKALRSFITRQSSLPLFIEFLRDLPEEARLGVRNEDKLAGEIADALASKREQNPLLRSQGQALDPCSLFADERGRTRISVISFRGLQTLDAQHVFLGQLTATLFGWIKRQPRPQDRPLHGLLVVDEARDFVPGNKATMCREGFLRLAAQARNYRFGLVFATQNPKDIINTIVSQCSTHLYGKMNAPATIEAARELLQSKGSSGDDVPRLGRGQFYVHNADVITRPVKIQTPMCLSRHE